MVTFLDFMIHFLGGAPTSTADFVCPYVCIFGIMSGCPDVPIFPVVRRGLTFGIWTHSYGKFDWSDRCH